MGNLFQNLAINDSEQLVHLSSLVCIFDDHIIIMPLQQLIYNFKTSAGCCSLGGQSAIPLRTGFSG